MTILNFFYSSRQAPFLGVILLKLAGNTYHGKNGIPLFCFIFKRIRTKIITFKDFLYFFNSAHFSSFKVDQIF